jgi:hypothetical protein
MAGSELGGIFSGGNPIKFNEDNPLPLFLVQVSSE